MRNLFYGLAILGAAVFAGLSVGVFILLPFMLYQFPEEAEWVHICWDGICYMAFGLLAVALVMWILSEIGVSSHD